MAFSGVTSMTGCWRFFAIEPKEGIQKKQAENRVALRCLALFAPGKVGSASTNVRFPASRCAARAGHTVVIGCGSPRGRS
jgi:hypothetical protein